MHSSMTAAPAPLTINEALRQAIAHHQAGQLQNAERLYRAILQTQPRHPDANHNLGVLATQVKQPAIALPLFKTALEAKPDQQQYWLSYIDVLAQTSQHDIARQILEQGRKRGLRGAAVDILAHKLNSLQSHDTLDLAENAMTTKETATYKEPTPQEINLLVALFNQKQYEKSEHLARLMTERFPYHGFGWKVLGAVLKQMGCLEDAILSMQKAIELLPDDAEVHGNLGNAYWELQQISEAEACYRRALELGHRHANIHSNFAACLNKRKCHKEAIASCHAALQIDPRHFGAYINLGNALMEQRRLIEAEACYRRATEIKPDYAEAHSNLGSVLSESGKLKQAVLAYETAIRCQPSMAETYTKLGNVFRFLDQADGELHAHQKALALDMKSTGLDSAVQLAIRFYLDGAIEQSANMRLACGAIMATTDPKHKQSRVYWEFLGKLLSWHQEHHSFRSSSPEREILYVVGESHSLNAHGITVRYRGQEMLCAAQWIPGCKQWHLGNDRPNKYKYQFEAIFARLPRKSTIFLTIGEIDCRQDEGIFHTWKKSPEKSLNGIVHSTIGGYIRYIDEIASRHEHRLIIGGVPATNTPLEVLAANDAKLFVNLIHTFNQALKNAALTSGIDFLDVYALTNRGDGIANWQWYIDSNHLLPSAIVEAFDKHCYTQSTGTSTS